MNTANCNSGSFQHFGRRADEHFNRALPRIKAAVKNVIAHLNDEAVPQVRRSSSHALRTFAGHLCRLAEHLERR